MSQRETIEFGYTDAQGNKRLFKSVDVTGLTEADIRQIKNQVHKEMYAFLMNKSYDNDYEEPVCGCNDCKVTVPKLDSEIQALHCELDEAYEELAKARAQISMLKELLKEAWTNGN